jgi:hypothetical protein
MIATTTEQTTAAPTDTPQPTSVDPDRVSVEGATLPYDANEVWERVAGLLETDASGPGTVVVQNISAERTPERSRFQRLLGVAAAPQYRIAGLTRPPGNQVLLSAAARNASTGLEVTLAHEYVHVAQLRERALERVWSAVGGTRDGRTTYQSVIEGAAVYVAQRYADRYVTETRPSIEARYENTTGLERFATAPYYYGLRYVADRFDDPSRLGQLYENPPRTTEELLHGLAPGSEPVAALSVDPDTDRQTRVEPRLGELYVRTVLNTALNESTAAEAAAGWGNDRLVRFGRTASADYAWVLRWDNASDATEFQRAAGAYVDARSGLNASIRVRKPGPETTVLFAGDASFTRNATATVSNGSVTVRTAQ